MAQIIPEVLEYLLSFLRPIDIGSEHHNKKGKAEQRMLRPIKREDDARTLVKKYFDVDMPETSSEASALVDHVLQSQKDTLKVSFTLSACYSMNIEARLVLSRAALSSWGIYISQGTLYRFCVLHRR